MKAFPAAALRCGLVLALCASENWFHASAAISTVTIGDNFFNPSSLTINVNDKVRWTWSGLNFHSTTSNTGLWDSGLHNTGFAFTNTFASAGSFPYHCTQHPLQTGSITVQAANVPPSVSISSPLPGAVFAEPWSGTIRANASDSDGSVLKVDFFANTTRLGTVSNPPVQVNFAVTNLPAGSYNLKAVAMDNRGATNSSAAIGISVLTPGPIELSAPVWSSPGSFQFSYSATPGLRYIIKRAPALDSWSPLATNAAASAQVLFTDPGAVQPVYFYSVELAPNP